MPRAVIAAAGHARPPRDGAGTEARRLETGAGLDDRLGLDVGSRRR